MVQISLCAFHINFTDRLPMFSDFWDSSERNFDVSQVILGEYYSILWIETSKSFLIRYNNASH